MKKNAKGIEKPIVTIETKEIYKTKVVPEQESRPNIADPKQVRASALAKTKKPNQDNPNEIQGFENKEEMNSVEQRLMRTKSSKPDKTYRTHIERNNNQTGIPDKEKKVQ